MFCFTMNLIIYYGLLQASSESSKMADTKPKILDNPDKIIAWKFPDVTESTQLRAIRLPDPLSASKVCSRSMPLIYTKKSYILFKVTVTSTIAVLYFNIQIMSIFINVILALVCSVSFF